MSEIIKKFAIDHKGSKLIKQEGSLSNIVVGIIASFIYSPLQKDFFNGDFGSLAFLSSEKKGIVVFNLDNYKKSTRDALIRYLDDKVDFREFKVYEEHKKKIVEYYLKNPIEKIKILSNEELEKVILDSMELLQTWQTVTLFCEALDEDILKEFIKENDNINFEEFIEKCSLIDFKSLNYLQNQAIIDFDENNPYLTQWVAGSYIDVPPLDITINHIKRTILDEGGLEQLKDKQYEAQKRIQEDNIISEKYKETLSEKFRNLFEYTKKTMEIRDVRKTYTFHAVTVFSNALREMFSRLNIPENYAIYANYQEILSGDYKKPGYLEELEKRKKGFLVYFGQDGVEIEYPQDYNKSKQDLLDLITPFDKNIVQINGNIGNGGFVRGVVKVIHSIEDFYKLNPGDILVTSMTRPEFVPLIKKSSAIITDEGGITCHAAIVSRELNKPCIIGTKISTQVLKDGMEVVVDADKGIVRILGK